MKKGFALITLILFVVVLAASSAVYAADEKKPEAAEAPPQFTPIGEPQGILSSANVKIDDKNHKVLKYLYTNGQSFNGIETRGLKAGGMTEISLEIYSQETRFFIMAFEEAGAGILYMKEFKLRGGQWTRIQAKPDEFKLFPGSSDPNGKFDVDKLTGRFVIADKSGMEGITGPNELLISSIEFNVSGPEGPVTKSIEPGGSMGGESVLAFVMKTNKGEIHGVLYPDDAPNTVLNFVTLARQGFYNGLFFHRVVPDFVIQTGDPQGDGTGGPGYSIPFEENNKKHSIGALGMARSQDINSGGSQFYICIADAHNLDGSYVVFGKVTSGLDVALQINKGDVVNELVIIGELPDKLKNAKLKKSR